MFEDGPTKALGYADDGSLMVCGRDPNTIMSILQNALNKTVGWGKNNGLTFATAKTQIVIFTSRYKIDTYPKLVMDGTQLSFSREVRYLGVILD